MMLNQADAAVRTLKDITGSITITTPVITVAATGGPALVVAAGVAIAIVLIGYSLYRGYRGYRGKDDGENEVKDEY